MEISDLKTSSNCALPLRFTAGFLFAVAVSLLSVAVAPARDIGVREAVETELLEQTRKLFWTGKYGDCVALCESGINAGRDYAFMRELLFRSLMAEGKNELAYENYEALLERNPESLSLLMAGHRLCQSLGKDEEAVEILREVNRLAAEIPRISLSAEDMVALGSAAFALGADPGKVLDSYLRAARAKEEHYGMSYLEAGRLALEKRDFAVASKEFRAGIKAYPGDPDMYYGLAESFFSSSRTTAGELIEKTLSINPRHTEAMRLKAEHLIDAELYEPAAEILADVLGINPHHPEAWALLAALAHFGNNAEEVARSRTEALASNADTKVDYVIGKSLSRQRRFAEGGEYQRMALEITPDFLPAKIQLAQDLLRLGREEEAWELVEEVHAADGYHVVAFNLATLRDEMKKFVTVSSDHFILRMTKREAGIYGARALEILEEAREVLGAKYGVSLDEPVLVEFFPSQSDFAVRTLGVPGGGGLLGVCFGSVITMNSPGSMAHGQNNWEATLWHEFTHVITLRLTQNKMTRWLSEGISVYEELQRNPNWGQRMTPRYRQMILEEEALRPVSEIGVMFLNPESAEDLMFAYYESFLVVDFLMGRYGIDPMRKVLNDLGKGESFEAATEAHFGGSEKLDREFAKFTLEEAKDFGKGVDWSAPEGVDPVDGEALAKYLKKKPKNFEAMRAYVIWLLHEERWKEAASWGEKLRKLYPDDRSEGSAQVILAKAYRELGELEKERAVLEELAGLSADAMPAMLRLLELETENELWAEGGEYARTVLAVNPFLARPHYFLGRASEAKGETKVAIEAYETVLQLDPEKSAEVHYRLATLVANDEPEATRRHLLDALAEAPRYRKAHRLLEKMAGVTEGEAPNPPSPQPTPEATRLTPLPPPSPPTSPPGVPVPDPKPMAEPKPGNRARRRN